MKDGVGSTSDLSVQVTARNATNRPAPEAMNESDGQDKVLPRLSSGTSNRPYGSMKVWPFTVDNVADADTPPCVTVTVVPS